MSTQAEGRIEGLCAWRAILMLGGPLLHATMGREDYPPFMAINLISGSFRMGSFFMIAGLLSGFALARRPCPTMWMRTRLVQLGIPTAFGVFVICPTIGLLMMNSSGQPMPISLYHLWFMVTLIGYTMMAYAVHRVDRRWPVFGYVERRTSRARVRQTIVLVGTGTLSFLLMIQTLTLTSGVTGRYASLTTQLPLAVGYAPVFLLGLAAARVPTLRRIVTNGFRMPALILIGAASAHILWRLPWRPAIDPVLAGSIDDLLLVAAAAFCPPAAAALILRSASAIRHVPPLLRRLSDASLTMYILHYPIIAALKLMTAPLGWHPWVEWVLAVVVASGSSYAIHACLVERSPFAALLLNGRPLPRTVHRPAFA